jgi:hypothetical protein
MWEGGFKRTYSRHRRHHEWHLLIQNRANRGVGDGRLSAVPAKGCAKVRDKDVVVSATAYREQPDDTSPTIRIYMVIFNFPVSSSQGAREFGETSVLSSLAICRLTKASHSSSLGVSHDFLPPKAISLIRGMGRVRHRIAMCHWAAAYRRSSRICEMRTHIPHFTLKLAHTTLLVPYSYQSLGGRGVDSCVA